VTDSPGDELQNLPDDIAGLRELALSAMAERDALKAERDAAVNERDNLLAQNDRLRHFLLKLTRMQFGPKSEQLPEEQLQLGLEATEQAIAKADAEAEKRDPELHKDNAAKRRASRGALPAHLPRIEVTLSPEDTACPCCQASMTVIGEDTSERLDVIPAQFRVIVTRRPKLACRACAGIVVQAPAPTRLIEGGIPTEAMVAHVLVARYADHLPLYRQAQILARQGIMLERSTLSFWMGYAAAEVAPVVARLREMVLASTRIFADETVVPVLDPGRGRTKHGYFWAIARDDRPWAGSQPPAVVYSYAPGRGHTHANTLFAGYRGILQCDGYGAYKNLVGAKSSETSVTLAFCWSHVRRGFYDLAKAKAPIAMETLQRIAALYAIEARVRGRSAADRLAVRHDVTRDRLTHGVAPLAAFHRMRDQQLDVERLPPLDPLRHVDQHTDHRIPQSMQAASVTSRSTLSRQQLPSASFATAITVCDVASRMRVAMRGAPVRGPNRTRITCGSGLPSANTSMLRTSPTGASTLTVMATEFPFSTITGRSSFTRASRRSPSSTSSAISAATSAGVACAERIGASGRIRPTPPSTRKRRRIMVRGAWSGTPPHPRSAGRSAPTCPAMRFPRGSTHPPHNRAA
jgi:transposase